MAKKKSHIVFTIIFALMITIPLYFRGLYFEEDLIPTLIGIFTIFLAWSIYKIKNDETQFLTDITDYLLLGIVFMYAISVFYGVNKRAALFELMRHMSYFIIFILAKSLAKDERQKKILINVVLLGGLFVSLVGIGTATGTWEYYGAMLGNRLSSTFQYPNTMAAYVASLYFLSLSMLINEENKLIKASYGALLGTFIFSLVLTYSRAMWLIFPLVGIVYFIVLPNKRKLESFIYIIGSAILSLPASFLFARDLSDPNSGMWKYYLLASIGTGVVILLASLLEKAYRKVPILALIIAIGILIAGVGAGVIYAINSVEPVEFANTTDQNKTTSLTRNISKTLPLSDYSLEVSYDVENNNEAPFSGRVRIFNIDNDKVANQLISHNIVETGQDRVLIEFSTPEDSIGTRIILDNYYVNTKATFKEVNLIDNTNGEVLYNVPLKYTYIPETIIGRVSSLGVGGTSADARIVFMKDGLDIVKDYPILGAGGGGWVTLYHRYQSYPYWTTQAHNYILQLWIEIGTLGLAMFLGLFLLITIFAIKTFSKEDKIENKVIIVGLYFTVLSMLGHAILDFDMSMPSYAMVFWTLTSILTSSIDFSLIKDNSKFKLSKILESKIVSYSIIAIAALLLVNSIQIKRSVTYADRGIEAADTEDVDAVITNFTKASSLDKYKVEYYHDLVNLYMQKYHDTGNEDYVQEAYMQSQKFVNLTQDNPVYYDSIASFYMSVGLIEESMDLLDKFVELYPMVAEPYIAKGNGYLGIFRYYYENEEYDIARGVLERALTMKEDLKEVSSRTIRPLSTSIDLIYKIGEIQYYLENFDSPDRPFAMGYNLDFAYYFDIDANNDGNIDMLHTSKPEGSEIDYEYIQDERDKFLRITNPGERYGFIYPYGIRLEPDTEYLVQVKARGNLDHDTLNIYAWSNGAADPNQGNITGVDLTDTWYPHIFQFRTDSDVEPGKQYIRIQLNGNDDGYVDIKELSIFKRP